MNKMEHLLTILAEECGELSQRATKALRFGLNEVQKDQPYTNARRILYEYNDLVAVINMLHRDGAFHGSMPSDGMYSEAMMKEKYDKVQKYLAYAREIGTLSESPGEKDLIIQGLEEGAGNWEQEYKDCRTLLRHLVSLKEMKDRGEGETDFYLQNKPHAWGQAKKFLEKYTHVE